MLTRKSKHRKRGFPQRWKLQDAKARFSEVVRKAQAEGPQRVTVHGKDAVVVIAASEFDRSAPSKGKPRTGRELVAAMRRGRELGLKLRPLRAVLPASLPLRFLDDGE
jgi:prevent-host-death family protein